MYQRYKERFGTVGLVVGVIAIILALGGTALAASGALSGKQKKEVEKIAKKFAGKPGAPGTNGQNGAPGSEGKQGPAGKEGPEGKQGEEGEPGPKGTTGSPWTAGGTLPAGKSETGTFGVFFLPETSPLGRLPISFPIPLAEDLPKSAIHLIEPLETGPTGCEGGTAEEPKAAPGNLCVYAGSGLNLKVFTTAINPEFNEAAASGNTEKESVGKAGVVLQEEGEVAFPIGTWVVTAPEP